MKRKLQVSLLLFLIVFSLFPLILEPSLSISGGSRAAGFYRTNTTATIPKRRDWNPTTEVWDSQVNMPTSGANPRWFRAVSCVNVQKRLIGMECEDGYGEVYVWNTTSPFWFTYNNLFNVTTGLIGYRAFDLAFETNSGEGLLVYSRGVTTNEIRYKTYSVGGSWSSEQSLDLPYTTGLVRWVRLVANPVSSSNEIAMMYVDANADTFGYVWTGSSWNAMGETAVWDASVATAAYQCFDIAYETTDGHAIFMWGDITATDFYYRHWNGATLTSATLLDIAAASQYNAWLRMKSHPSNNSILMAEVSVAAELSTAYWNGATWTVHAEHESTIDAYQRQAFDVEFEADGSQALLCYGTSAYVAGRMTYRTIDFPDTLGTKNNVTYGSNAHWWITLMRNPYVFTGDVSILGVEVEQAANDIGSFKWNGTTLTVISATAFTTNCGTTTYPVYAIMFLHNVPPAGSDYGVSTPILGLTTTFYCFWSGVSLNKARFGWNPGTGWVNNSWVDPWTGTPNTGWFNVTKTLPTEVVNVSWRMWASDSGGVNGSIPLQWFFTSATYYAYENVEVNSFTFNQSKPNMWVSAGTGLSFKGVNRWVTNSLSTTEWGNWINLTEIDTDDTANWVRGYELEIYDANSSTWKSPNSTYASCGTNPANFIDSNTGTYWTHTDGVVPNHYYTATFDSIIQMSQIRIYVGSTTMSNFTCNAYVGKRTGWGEVGSYKWINATDETNYILSDKADRTFGEINFTTSRMSILSSWFIANLSIASVLSKVRVEFYNASATRHFNLTVTGASQWQIYNVSLSPSFWNPCKRLYTLKSYDANLIKIDHVYLHIKFVNITSVSKIIPHASYGIMSIHAEGTMANALFYHYLDQTDSKFKILAFDTINLEWTEIYTVGNSPSTDGHYAPSIAVLPNNSLIIFHCYLSQLYYKISNYTLDNQANLTTLITNWKPNNNLTLSTWYQYGSGVDSERYSYPTAISAPDRVLVFCRRGESGSTFANWTQLTFKDDVWTEKKLVDMEDDYTVYAEAIEIDTKIYLTYNKLNTTATGSPRYNLYLIVSEDYGITWKNWNNTIMTIPVSNEPLVFEQNATVYSYSVWDDENGKTNILYVWADNPPWYPLSNQQHYVRIVQANATIPNANAVWSNMSAIDEYDNTLLGNTFAGYLDKDINRSTIWVNPNYFGRQDYVAKYVRINGTDNKYAQYFTYTDYSIVRYFARPIIDYSIPFEAYSYAWERDIMGAESTCTNTVNSTSGMWLFKFTAQRSLNISHIAVRMNSTYDYKEGRYSAAIYNSALTRLGTTTETIPGSFGMPPRDSWDVIPLGDEVPIVKGNEYWIGFYNMSSAFKYFYNITTSGNGCLFTTEQAPATISSPTYYNRTGSIYAVKAQTIIWGLWDKLEFVSVGANYTCIRGGKAYNVAFHAKVVDYRGINGTKLYQNRTGAFQFNLTTSSGASSLWSNWTLSINISQGSRLAWYYWAINTLGDTEQTATFYIYTQFNYYGNVTLSVSGSSERTFAMANDGIANLDVTANAEQETEIQMAKSATLSITPNQQHGFSFFAYPSASLAVSISSTLNNFLNLFSSIALNIVESFQRAFSFNLHSFVTLTLTPNGIATIIAANLLYFYGTVTLSITETFTKAVHFYLNPSVILSITPTSYANLIGATLLNLYGSVTLNIIETMTKTVAFNIQGNAILNLIVNSFHNIYGNILHFYGNVQLRIHHSLILVGTSISDTETAIILAILGIVLAISLPLVFMVRRRRE